MHICTSSNLAVVGKCHHCGGYGRCLFYSVSSETFNSCVYLEYSSSGVTGSKITDFLYT